MSALGVGIGMAALAGAFSGACGGAPEPRARTAAARLAQRALKERRCHERVAKPNWTRS